MTRTCTYIHTYSLTQTEGRRKKTDEEEQRRKDTIQYIQMNVGHQADDHPEIFQCKYKIGLETKYSQKHAGAIQIGDSWVPTYTHTLQSYKSQFSLPYNAHTLIC